MSATSRFLSRSVVLASATMFTLGCVTAPSYAQEPYPNAQQPAPAPYPSAPQPAPAPYPGVAPMSQQQYVAPPKPNPIRELFVGTLSAVLQGATGAIAGSLVQGVTGSITNWFAKKSGNYAGAMQANPYGAAAPYPAAPAPYDPNNPYATAQSAPAAPYDPNAPYGTNPYPQTSNPYPQTTNPYPGTSSPNDPYATQPQAGTYPAPTDPYATQPAGTTSPYANPNDPYAAAATQYYDPQTGQTGSAAAYGYANTTSGYEGTLYAGLAYEVHALQPGGGSMPINAATYEFRTGDRFMVHYRPSLPGRLDVFNINPLGVQTRIDTVEMAAGQLASLGPYEFRANKGDEALKLVLSPCSTPQLLTATRDIVNVSGNVPASGGVSFNSCGVVGRSVGKVKTRDIAKVAVDGTTSFALDPVSQTELNSGDMSPREITIVFHHR